MVPFNSHPSDPSVRASLTSLAHSRASHQPLPILLEKYFDIMVRGTSPKPMALIWEHNLLFAWYIHFCIDNYYNVVLPLGLLRLQITSYTFPVFLEDPAIWVTKTLGILVHPYQPAQQINLGHYCNCFHLTIGLSLRHYRCTIPLEKPVQST